MDTTKPSKRKRESSKDQLETKKKKRSKDKDIESQILSTIESSADVEKAIKRKEKSAKKEMKEKKQKKEKAEKTKKPAADTTETEHTPGEESKPAKRKRGSEKEDKKSKKQKKEKIESAKAVAYEELEIDIALPTPPSKKALRLQKKGKPLPKLPSTSLPPVTLTPATDNADVHPDRKGLVKEIPRAEFSVWIGNLSYKSDVAALRGWLVRGEKRITDKDITRMNLPLNADGQSKGYLPAPVCWSELTCVGLRMWILRRRRLWRWLFRGVRRVWMGGIY